MKIKKQSNANSEILDAMIKQAGHVKPKNSSEDFAKQIMSLLKTEKQTLNQVIKSAANQVRANKVAQFMDNMPDNGPEMPMDESPVDETIDEELNESPLDEAPLDEGMEEESAISDSPDMEDPASMLQQAMDLLARAQEKMQGQTAEGVEDIADPASDVSLEEDIEEPIGEESIEEPLDDNIGIDEELETMPMM